MQSSIVGLSILWGLASFGVQGDFIESRDTASPSWQAESRVEMEGYLMESLGADRWVFDNGSESLEISLPKGQWVSTGERLGCAANPCRSRAAGCCRCRTSARSRHDEASTTWRREGARGVVLTANALDS